MKKVLLVLALFLFSAAAFADATYPWVLTLYGGGASQCITDEGCFSVSGPAVGGSFGRPMSRRWSFELDGFWTRGSELLPPRIDLGTGIVFTPKLQRTRIYGGAMFLAKIGQLSKSMDMFIVIGAIGGYEQQVEIVPAGVFHAPTKDIGLKGGLAGGAGFNWWFSEHWGIRPEVRYYAVVDSLSSFRYTAGIMRRF